MTRSIFNSPRGELAGMLALSFAVFAAFWIGEGFKAALPPLLILLAFTALIHLGRSRSETVAIMSGIGDERTAALYTRAAAATAIVLSLVLPAWWLVTVARGDANETLAAVCAIFGVVFIAASLVLARRG